MSTRRVTRRPLPALAALTGAAVLASAGTAAAAPSATLMAKDPNGPRTQWVSSTFTAQTFKLTNTGTEEITSFQLDLADGPALFPRLAFDPDDGSPAGDNQPKSYTSDAGDIESSATYGKPVGNGVQLLTVTTSGFGPGETLAFSIDVDPITTQGGPASPAPPAAHTSAAELHGATLRVSFAGGATLESDLSLIPGQVEPKQRDSQAYVSQGAPGAPGLVRAAGYPSPATTPQAAQSVVVTRPASAGSGTVNGRIVVAEGHFDRTAVPASAPAGLPYEANTVRTFREYPFTIPAGAATTTVAIQLSNTPHMPDPPYPNDAPDVLGLNYVTAFLVNGATSYAVSAPLVMRLDPSAPAEQPPPPGGGGAGVPNTPIPPAVAPAPDPVCATGLPAAASSGTGATAGRVTLTDRQLLINQRISQAAVRRLNALQSWLDAGVAARDICGGSIGADRLATGITLGVGAPPVATAADPRPIVVAGRAAGRRGKVTVSLEQLRINDRIARAALQRAKAIEARLGAGLTGGDLRPGAVGRTQLAPGLVVTSIPVAATSAARTRTVPSGSVNGPAVRFEASQLLRTQRVAQQAVRITNTLTVKLSRGLRGTDFRAGSIGSPGLTP